MFDLINYVSRLIYVRLAYLWRILTPTHFSESPWLNTVTIPSWTIFFSVAERCSNNISFFLLLSRFRAMNIKLYSMMFYYSSPLLGPGSLGADVQMTTLQYRLFTKAVTKADNLFSLKWIYNMFSFRISPLKPRKKLKLRNLKIHRGRQIELDEQSFDSLRVSEKCVCECDAVCGIRCWGMGN